MSKGKKIEKRRKQAGETGVHHRRTGKATRERVFIVHHCWLILELERFFQRVGLDCRENAVEIAAVLLVVEDLRQAHLAIERRQRSLKKLFLVAILRIAQVDVDVLDFVRVENVLHFALIADGQLIAGDVGHVHFDGHGRSLDGRRSQLGGDLCLT